MINRGKQFEQLIQKQFEKIEDTLVLRLYDVTTGYKNQNNICDFIVFKYPNIILLECKTTNQSTLNFKSQIRPNQLSSLLRNKNKKGVIPGILCWFIKNDKTIFIPIDYIQELMDNNHKSFNINNYNKSKVIELIGNKKRVFFEYDLESFLEGIEYE